MSDHEKIRPVEMAIVRLLHVIDDFLLVPILRIRRPLASQFLRETLATTAGGTLFRRARLPFTALKFLLCAATSLARTNVYSMDYTPLAKM